jgi:hypothetical protein
MKRFLLTSALFLSVSLCVPARAAEPPKQSHNSEAIAGAIGNLFFSNIGVLIAGVAFIYELKNQVARITDKIEAINALQKVEIESIKEEIGRLSGNSQQELTEVTQKLKGIERTLFKLIDFINSDRAKERKHPFVVSKYDHSDS